MSVFSVRIDTLNEAADKYARVISNIDSQIQSYTDLIQEIDNSWDGLASRVFVSRMRTETTKLTYMRKYTVALQKYCKDTAERMETIDKLLRKILEMVSGIWGTITGGDNTTHGGGGTQIPESSTEQYNNQQAALMENMLANNIRVDTSKYADATYYDYYDSDGNYRKNWGVYRNTNGCTWYAYNRYMEMNPDIGHLFAGNGGGGNANNWVNSIDKNKFNVLSTGDNSVIKCNSIAVSTQSDTWEQGIRASGNHVAYIEAVKDGYVYYTDGSYGSPEESYGYVQKVPIEVFAKDYEYVISAK